MTGTLLSIGHGYSARELGQRLLTKGWRVIGTTRSAEKAEALAATGVEPLIWPGSDLGPALSDATHLLTSVAPGAEGDPVLADAGEKIGRAASGLKWAGYLSTTGVYGDRDGGWVDEDSALTPSTKRGKARVTAEAAWNDIPDLPLHIFRLAGIYGPGRGPFAKVQKPGAQRIIKKNQIFSRCHVEDIATVLEASIATPNPGRIYNICDDDPAPPEDVLEYAAKILGVPVPPAVPFEEAEMSPMARSFYSDSKRVRNDRIKSELGVKLRYPTYKQALDAMLRSERGE